MNDNELITIIIPCYNVAPYIVTTVQSILRQTYQNIELILVNDGSTDDTGKVLGNLKNEDNRIVVIHKENGGVTSARLAGVEIANGEWIAFVDGDDEIEPEMYERLLNNAHKYHADISHCGYQMVYPTKVVYYYNTGRLVEQNNLSGLYDLLSGSFVEPGLWNKLYSKGLLQNLFQSGLMDTSIKHNEDLLMNYYLFKQANKAIYDDFCPYHYQLRIGSACVSDVNQSKLIDPLKVFKIIKSDLNDDKLIHVVNNRICGILISLSTRNLGKQKDLIKPIRTEARKELRELLPKILKGKYSVKTKLLTAWCAIWPWSYQIIHTVYSNIKGTAHAYTVCSE